MVLAVVQFLPQLSPCSVFAWRMCGCAQARHAPVSGSGQPSWIHSPSTKRIVINIGIREHRAESKDTWIMVDIDFLIFSLPIHPSLWEIFYYFELQSHFRDLPFIFKDLFQGGFLFFCQSRISIFLKDRMDKISSSNIRAYFCIYNNITTVSWFGWSSWPEIRVRLALCEMGKKYL